MSNFQNFFSESSAVESHPITFIAPELPEETLLEVSIGDSFDSRCFFFFNAHFLHQREHNETLAKINFVLALSNCILELAASRAAPISALVDAVSPMQPQSEMGRRAEQLVLMVRALQLLGSGLSLATQQLKNGQLRPSSTVKNGKLFFCIYSVVQKYFSCVILI